jgi:hypothetical protein
MYLMINGEKYSVSRREKNKNQVTYYGVEPAVSEISGIIEMFRDDGFPMSVDNTAHYASKSQSGTRLVLSTTLARARVAPSHTTEHRISVLETEIAELTALVNALLTEKGLIEQNEEM